MYSIHLEFSHVGDRSLWHYVTMSLCVKTVILEPISFNTHKTMTFWLMYLYSNQINKLYYKMY